MYRSRWESSNKALVEMAEEVLNTQCLDHSRLQCFPHLQCTGLKGGFSQTEESNDPVITTRFNAVTLTPSLSNVSKKKKHSLGG